MTETTVDSQQLTLIEAAQSEVFANWAQSFAIVDGNVHISFSVRRFNHETNRVHMVIIGTLVMPMNGAQGLALGLYDYLKGKGFDPAPKPPSEKMQ